MVPATITGTQERSHYTSDVPSDQGMTSWYQRRSQVRLHGTTVSVTIIQIHEWSGGTSDVPRDTGTTSSYQRRSQRTRDDIMVPERI